MQLIQSKQLKKSFAPYSKGTATGGLIFFSGQVALNDDGDLVTGGIEAEAQKIFDNIDILLNENKLTISNIAKLNIYITKMNEENFSTFNKVYTNWVGLHRPARTAIGVFSLPKNGNVEIEFIAEKV
jgi:2-iminobutanoate/2-iminopropanoate deaminase